MMEPFVTCPQCQAEIPLTQSLAAPLIEQTRQRYEERLAAASSKAMEKESKLAQQRLQLEKARSELENEVAARVAASRKEIVAAETKKARDLLRAELDESDRALSDLKRVLAQRDSKLAEAQKAQAELLKKERELDDQRRELELTVEKRVQQSLGEERAKGKRDAEAELKLTVTEKEQTITALQKQILDLKRRAEQGSQQLQGEAQELVLEDLIRSRFPLDEVEPVPKGEHGGDVVHRIMLTPGECLGTLLWESKRTKNWSDGWLSKLRADQRAAKADIAILMTQVLPKGIDTFDQIGGIWVVSPRNAMAVCLALRSSLIEIAKARKAGEGQESKMQLVYGYLTGPQFRQRIEAIVDKFTEMQADLEKERRVMTKSWAKREQQIRLVVDSTAGMYGDLQAIAGSSLNEIEGLETPLLETSDNTEVNRDNEVNQ